MAEVRNESRFSGPYMVQDRDHMSEIPAGPEEAGVGGSRQPEQSQSSSRQQGSVDQRSSREQGHGDQGSSQQGGGRRQNY
jgi:hypothetical protein